MKLRKKPIEVEGIKWIGNNIEEIKEFTQDGCTFIGEDLYIWNNQEKQWISAPIGHTIIKGVKGEFYPCSQEVLDKSYDVVE